MYRRVLGAAALAALLFAPAARSQELPEGLPEGVTPLPEKLGDRVSALMKEAETYRGLAAKTPVPSGTVDDPALRKKMVESFQADLPPATLRPVETSLKAFGLIPESLDLVKFFPELLTSQVAGFYDPERHYLALVQRDGQAMTLGLGDNAADAARKAEEAVLVHELTHALQDQHFHLETFASGEPLDDADIAKVALVEGDATLVMMDFFAGMSLASLPGIETSMDEILGDPRKLLASTPGVPGGAELASAPAWFQDTLLFSYFEGFQFCLSTRRLGGQALLDHAFTQDPPRSSEQILHPEKWHTRRDDPIVLPWPDLSRTLPGWNRVAEAQLGEMTIRTLFRGALKNDERAEKAAAGWGGDRFAVYEKEGERLLLWVTEWDADADAREFQVAAKDLGRGWEVRRTGRRVMVTRGSLPKPVRTALWTALETIRAERPANRAIDLAAIGVETKEKKSPRAEFLELPQTQELLEKMSQELPPGEVSEDGRTYTNPSLGFSIGTPRSERGWTLKPTPGIPSAVLMISNPDGDAHVTVIHVPMGMPVDIEAMGPMIEMGIKMPMTSYKSYGSGMVETAGGKAYEVEYEAEQEGMKVRGLARFYGQGNNALMAVAVASPPERWKRNEKALRDSLDSLLLKTPEPPAGGMTDGGGAACCAPSA